MCSLGLQYSMSIIRGLSNTTIDIVYIKYTDDYQHWGSACSLAAACWRMWGIVCMAFELDAVFAVFLDVGLMFPAPSAWADTVAVAQLCRPCLFVQKVISLYINVVCPPPPPQPPLAQAKDSLG